MADCNQRSLETLARVITLSQHQFALVLARCNYSLVRDRMAQALQARLPFPIPCVTLPESAKTLYTTLQLAIKKQAWNLADCEPSCAVSGMAEPIAPPRALMIFGLETVQDLDQAFVATNIVREEFRKQFQFPLVLWVNDDVLRKLERLAPDLASWAGNAIIEFEMAIPEIVRSLRHHSDRLFDSILSWGDEQFWATWQLPPPNALRPNELKFAIDDLQANQYTIDAEMQASLDFLRGQTAHSQQEMEQARELYERSLAFWLQHMGEDTSPLPSSPSPAPLPPIPYLERAACVLFYLGLWWRSYSVLQRATFRNACQQAQQYFQYSLKLFSQENRQDLVARFIAAEAETLQKLQQWDELEAVAKQSLVLHKLYRDPVREARDRGFLAEVAIARADWQTAKQQVETALQILDTLDAEIHTDDPLIEPHLETSLELAHRYHYSWYLFLFAKVESELGNLNATIHHLETARDRSHPQDDPPLYIQILQKLRDAYFAKGKYRLAFRTRQARRLIQHQYGYRAFVGALRLQPQEFASGAPLPLPAQIDQQRLLTQELEASGRQKDLHTLLARLSQAQYKLIVIHGPSGVGKSSILNAGLFTLLQEISIDGRIPVPLLLDFYNGWETGLKRNLTKLNLNAGLDDLPTEPQSQGETLTPTSTSVLDDLKAATDRNYLPILLLDQFEEFFFTFAKIQDRLPFYRFLSDCLKLPFVKVVLSLREDYLHYLLEFQRYGDLDIINNDILGKHNRYPLGDLTIEDAKAVITSLTHRAQFYLPDDLIAALVADLAGDLGEVRPIELQVVGAQLQAEGIDTLGDYLKKGPKEKLVQRSLEDVIEDCGPENENLARIILYLLTSENGTRPLKTREDLESDLVDLGLIQANEVLDLVLEVLLGAGLVFLIPDSPADCYQLVHDYLVGFIRQEQESEVAQLRAELQQEKERIRTELPALQQQLHAAAYREYSLDRQNENLRQQLQRSQRQTLLITLILVSFNGLLAVLLAIKH